MNHQPNCDRTESYLSGNGYNRVRVCACGAEDHEPEPTAEQDTVTVTIDADDRIELSHMLRGRGGSDLKTKLLEALATLDTRRAAKLRKDQE